MSKSNPVKVTKVFINDQGPHFSQAHLRGKQKAGLAYEKKFHSMMKLKHGKNYHSNVWFHYQSHGTWHWCQPDGILVQPELERITIFECKLKHTDRSYYQLMDLYLPVVSAAFGSGFNYFLVEVCCTYDPAIPYPVKADLLRELLSQTIPRQIGVYQWKP